MQGDILTGLLKQGYNKMVYITNPKIKNDKMYQGISDYVTEYHYKKNCNANITLIKDRYNSKGQCFNYATKNYDLGFCEDCLEYVYEFYKEIDIDHIKKGDIVIFFDGYEEEDCGEETCQHFGVIFNTDNTILGTVIRSKWGGEAIYEGNLNDLPEMYGNMVKFYRKK